MGVPKWAKFMARDINGTWWFFEHEPLINDRNKWECAGQFVAAYNDPAPQGQWCNSKTPVNVASDRQEGGDHYKSMGVEPWDVVDTWPLEQRIGYYRGGALKYLMRMGSKDESAQEVAKGKHYMEKLLEVLK